VVEKAVARSRDPKWGIGYQAVESTTEYLAKVIPLAGNHAAAMRKAKTKVQSHALRPASMESTR
jgi:hypothetical protein